MRGLRDRLADLGRTRQASERVARRSAVWRSQRVPVVRERENAGHLDLLGGSCLLLARTASAADASQRDRLAATVRELADALDELAKEPGDRAARQRAADRALAVARGLGDASPGDGLLSAAVTFSVRMVAADIMVFAGVDEDEVEAAVREGAQELDVPGSAVRAAAAVQVQRWPTFRWPWRRRAPMTTDGARPGRRNRPGTPRAARGRPPRPRAPGP